MPAESDERRLTVAEEDRIADLEGDLAALERGVGLSQGVANPALEEVRGGVGAARIRQLRDKLLALTVDDGVWPRPCRYVGRPLGHHAEGKALKPGDVVMLGRESYLALSDRFTVEASAG